MHVLVSGGEFEHANIAADDLLILLLVVVVISLDLCGGRACLLVCRTYASIVVVGATPGSSLVLRCDALLLLDILE